VKFSHCYYNEGHKAGPSACRKLSLTSQPESTLLSGFDCSTALVKYIYLYITVKPTRDYSNSNVAYPPDRNYWQILPFASRTILLETCGFTSF